MEINDEIFRSSWRKIIRLPLIFKAVDYDRLIGSTEEILSQLEVCYQQLCDLGNNLSESENLLADFLSQYCSAFMESVSLLKGIIHQLNLKSKRSDKYSQMEHQQQCRLYNDAVNKYIAMSDRLNKLYRDVGLPCSRPLRIYKELANRITAET